MYRRPAVQAGKPCSALVKRRGHDMLRHGHWHRKDRRLLIRSDRRLLIWSDMRLLIPISLHVVGHGDLPQIDRPSRGTIPISLHVVGHGDLPQIDHPSRGTNRLLIWHIGVLLARNEAGGRACYGLIPSSEPSACPQVGCETQLLAITK